MTGIENRKTIVPVSTKQAEAARRRLLGPQGDDRVPGSLFPVWMVESASRLIVPAAIAIVHEL